MFVRSRWSAALLGVAATLVLTAQTYAAVVCPSRLNVGNEDGCDWLEIQDAVDAACPGTTIVISEDVNPPLYTGQHTINIVNKTSLTIVARGLSCSNPTPLQLCDPTLGCGGSPPAQGFITGDGNGPVISISGGGPITIANLTISGGQGTVSPGGGGINIVGSTSVTLNNVTVSNNTGLYGGGIAFNGDGSLHLQGANVSSNSGTHGGGVGVTSSPSGHVEFVIDDAVDQMTQITSNQSSVLGGGIYVDGNVHLLAKGTQQHRIGIFQNSATSAGGGIYFSGTAFADIANPGAFMGNNTAAVGGAITVDPSTSGNVVLRLFSVDANDPSVLFGNSASFWGGAIVADGALPTTHATVCIFDAGFANNSAGALGRTLYANDGSHLLINPDDASECDYSAVASLGAVHCDPAHPRCNIVTDITQFGMGPAAEIDFTGAAQVTGRRLHVSATTASSIVRGTSGSASAGVAFSQCLIDHNTTSAALVSLQGASAAFDSCTFADDSIAASPLVFAFDTGLSVTRSIVHEGVAAFPGTTSGLVGLTAQYLILNEPQLPGSFNTVSYSDPFFVDAAGGDYHLQSASPAIDFAPLDPPESPSGDFDLWPRVIDIGDVTNVYGPRDLGAYEYHLPDPIFMSGFDP